MLDAGNIHIKLLPLNADRDQPQHFNYPSLTEAVKDYEEIRKLASLEKSGDFHIQLCCNDKIISQRYLRRADYKAVLQLIDHRAMHAA